VAWKCKKKNSTTRVKGQYNIGELTVI